MLFPILTTWRPKAVHMMIKIMMSPHPMYLQLVGTLAIIPNFVILFHDSIYLMLSTFGIFPRSHGQIMSKLARFQNRYCHRQKKWHRGKYMCNRKKIKRSKTKKNIRKDRNSQSLLMKVFTRRNYVADFLEKSPLLFAKAVG